MKWIVALSFACVFELSAQEPDDPLSCVDPKIAAAFLSGYGNQGVPSITLDLPPDFDGMQEHEALDLIGVSVQKHGSNIAFESSLGRTETVSVLRQLMRDRGWAEIAQHQNRSKGFRAPLSAPSNHLSMCANGKGNATIMAHEYEGTTIVNLMRHMSRGYGRSCTIQQAYNQVDTNQVMPVLEIPEDAKHTGGFGTSSSGDAISSESQFDLKLSSVRLLAHFDAQLEAQGWVFDSGWDGKLSSGSVWSSRHADSQWVGILSLVSRSGKHDAKFSAKRLPE